MCQSAFFPTNNQFQQKMKEQMNFLQGLLGEALKPFYDLAVHFLPFHPSPSFILFPSLISTVRDLRDVHL
jgi:hypothetical protein